ncbi:kinesin motor protein cin8 [Saitozyma podzolica]|uniref:Kinesin-like protein n=1 Tax=Saitozyma podzolica TaxID=1890683 RepID=A0A427Y3L0_9TREE|nr:kinesin motor protein cin8 [Saitozyma podzolica]
MQGDLELSPLSAPKDSAGIVPRVLHRLFSLLESGSIAEYSVKCSYVELYNEELRDLLSTEYTTDKSQVTGLKLYEDGKKGVMIQGLEETGVRNLKEALAMLNKGCQRRQVAETKMNTDRSHTIFTLTVHVKETSVTGGEDLLRIGKFNLVDLAGSEAIGRSGATDKRAREAGMINQSLLTLGRVISALVEKSSHIPYRESKLTRLLQDSLGGRTKTCIVATVSPTRSNMEETLSTLDYAIRAKSIRNRPELNAHLTKAGLLKEYIGDIERLKQEVLAAREKNGVYIPEDQWREMHEAQAKQKSDYEEAKLRASSATIELETKKKEFEQLTGQFILTTEELERTKEAERQLGVMIEETKAQLEIVRLRLEEERVVSEAFQAGETRLHGVAGQLRTVANESVSDVGGLFDKLGSRIQRRRGDDIRQRPAGALGRAPTRSRTFPDASGGVWSDAQERAGEACRTSRSDIAALDASFASFSELTKSLGRSIEQGKADAATTNESIRKVSDEVQASVRQWAATVGERSGKMVEDLLEHQQGHLSMVSVLDDCADGSHLDAETEAHARAQERSKQMADQEISRLRAQNVLLAKLLGEEKAKTARLRTELIGNLTNLIVGFTDAQDASWSEVVDKVQVANEQGVGEMERWIGQAEEVHAESSRRTENMRGELVMAERTATSQREAGVSALRDVSEGMRTRLEEYGAETQGMATSQVEAVDGFCGKMGSTAVEDERAQKQSKRLGALFKSASETHNASRSRAAATADAIDGVSSALLEGHASSSETFTATHSAASSTLSNMLDTTAEFLSNGILEDVPTGVTPRKKSWSVTQSWQRTQPRDALIEAFRRRQGGDATTGVSAPVEIDAEVEQENTLPTVASSESISSAIDEVKVNPLSLSTSQIRPPKSKLAQVTGRKTSAGDEKMQMAILGEGGVNVPRRVKRQA